MEMFYRHTFQLCFIIRHKVGPGKPLGSDIKLNTSVVGLGN
jgi:hypothetical protein